VDPIHPDYKSDQLQVGSTGHWHRLKIDPVYAEDTSAAEQSASLGQLPAGEMGIDGAMRQLMGFGRQQWSGTPRRRPSTNVAG